MFFFLRQNDPHGETKYDLNISDWVGFEADTSEEAEEMAEIHLSEDSRNDGCGCRGMRWLVDFDEDDAIDDKDLQGVIDGYISASSGS